MGFINDVDFLVAMYVVCEVFVVICNKVEKFRG